MDPTAALRELLDALRTQDRDAAFGGLETLLDWLSKGGAFPRVPGPPADASHQGWANYETWAVRLWLANDEGLYRSCDLLAREAVEDADACDQVNDGIWSREQARRFMLADRLKEFLAESNPLADRPSVFADLLGSALDAVSYDELADAFLDDVVP